MSNLFIQELFDGPIDIVGDIHGEYLALLNLLKNLGYNEDGIHPDGRKLVFSGDLCDRGENSIAVIRKIKQLVDANLAKCVLGNHELNLLLNLLREGNGWFYGSPHDDDKKAFKSVLASEEDRQEILNFLNTLPIALESKKLRVVHASWHQESINALRKIRSNTIQAIHQKYNENLFKNSKYAEFMVKTKARKNKIRNEIKDENKQIPFIYSIAKYDYLKQMSNPVSVITSGQEKITKTPYYVSGKWRFVERDPWWNNYNDNIPVVIGHYWRKHSANQKQSDLFKGIHPFEWFGKNKNVFCVDYSVGKRFIDRHLKQEFSTKLGALRFPEKVVVFEDGSCHPTN